MEEREIKIKQIEIINHALDEKELMLSPEDFDILYDLPLDELMNVRFEIESNLKT